MRLAYVDESASRECFYMSAVVVNGEQARQVSQLFDRIVIDAANAHGLSPRAEIHAHDIAHGKRDWSPLANKVRARVGILEQCANAIASVEPSIILRGVNMPRLRERYGAQAHSPRFVVSQHLFEQINAWCEDAEEFAVVVADEMDDPDDERSRLRDFKELGTQGFRHTNLARLVDTIHYSPSHASRLIQAADVVAYIYRRNLDKDVTNPKARKAATRMWSVLRETAVHANCWHPKTH